MEAIYVSYLKSMVKLILCLKDMDSCFPLFKPGAGCGMTVTAVPCSSQGHVSKFVIPGLTRNPDA
ncbi:hypothetical protein MBAV_005200 [Candidatus Magnetobacterium bavaricum]|uniref:Uncharacterized protein n=1 Tax=Candidatus Magnetobacterium bavaricum TaxID=29290 RepID=A0A0F3GKW3_9BACT|nr:hypothetical protein MBAV_005200 [Candidatus Magnetobacterium bavaricum]